MPPPTTIHYHLPPAKIYPPPPITTRNKPKSKIYLPPPTTSQKLDDHPPKAKIYPYITSF